MPRGVTNALSTVRLLTRRLMEVMSAWNDLFLETAKLENQSIVVFIKLAPETNYQDLWWDTEIESKKPKSFLHLLQLYACKCRESSA